jgi:hypothetical protein
MSIGSRMKISIEQGKNRMKGINMERKETMTGGAAQVVACLSSNYEALSSNSINAKTKAK